MFRSELGLRFSGSLLINQVASNPTVEWGPSRFYFGPTAILALD